MALRNAAGTAARMTAGFWSEVARTISPQSASQPTRVEPRPPEPDPEPAPPPVDGVLVPVDTWTRVMDQLGHLHEAGQELAEARERAARAETQVEFLREQLATAKAKPRPRPKKAEPTPEVVATPAPSTGSRRDTLRAASRTRVAGVRNRVSGWISAD